MMTIKSSCARACNYCRTSTRSVSSAPESESTNFPDDQNVREVVFFLFPSRFKNSIFLAAAGTDNAVILTDRQTAKLVAMSSPSNQPGESLLALPAWLYLV